MNRLGQIALYEPKKTPGAAENSSLSKSSSEFLRTRVSASRKTAFENWVNFQQLICERGWD